MGWNDYLFKKETPLFKNLQEEFYLYFGPLLSCNVDDRYSIGKTQYGYEFVNPVNRDKSMEFNHTLEKSHNNGLKIIENF